MGAILTLMKIVAEEEARIIYMPEFDFVARFACIGIKSLTIYP